MTFPLTSLPPEILSYIASFLEADDVLNLDKCVPLVVDKQVYGHAFRDNTNFAHYDMDMFQHRANASLYLIGGGGGIGEKDYYEPVMNGEYWRMFKFRKVEGGGIISEARLTNNKQFALTPEGRVYISQLDYSSDDEDSARFEFRPAKAREQMNDDYITGTSDAQWLDWNDGADGNIERYRNAYDDLLDTLPPQPVRSSSDIIEFSEHMYRQPYKPVRFVQLATGDFALALDDHGMLWVWQRTYLERKTTSQGVPLCLTDSSNGALLTNRVLDIGVHGETLVASLEGIGLVIWGTLIDDDYARKTNPNGTRSGYPCIDGHFCECKVTVLPGTADITMFQVGEGTIVYLGKDGYVSGRTLQNSVEDFQSDMEKLNVYGPFKQIDVLATEIGLVTYNGCVVTVTLKRSDNLHPAKAFARVVTELDFKVAALAVGLTHFVALSEEGDVYTWGEEVLMSGYLGLGHYEDAMRIPGIKVGPTKMFDEQGLIVDHPTKIKLPGKAYAVFAEAIYTGVLVDDSA